MTDSSVVMKAGMLLAKKMSIYVKWRPASQRRQGCVVVPIVYFCDKVFAAVPMMMMVWLVCCC